MKPRVTIPVRARLLRKVCVEDNGCWRWLGAIGRNGYGKLGVGTGAEKRVESAHRVSWSLWNGPIPSGFFVCHRCDHKWCVNPEHLFLGSAADNISDASSKGRLAVGLRLPHAKLSPEIIRMIRALSLTMTQRELADKYGVVQSQIQAVLSGKSWKHVE